MLHHLLPLSAVLAITITTAAVAPPPSPPAITSSSPTTFLPDSSTRSSIDLSRLSGSFLHITDIHPDQYASINTTASNACHPGGSEEMKGDQKGKKHHPKRHSTTLERRFRGEGEGTGKGGPVGPPRVSGEYGLPNSLCDSPMTLTNATMSWVGEHLLSSLDFVVWTGDNVRHDADDGQPRTFAEIMEFNRMMVIKFQETLYRPERPLPIVPSIGNNDVFPQNVLAMGPNPVLQAFSEIWSDLIPSDQLETFRKGGYFISEVVPQKVAVISLGSLYFSIKNKAVEGCIAEDQPGTVHLRWLAKQLEMIRSRGMVVYLAGHVPPDDTTYYPSCLAWYVDLSLDYQDVIQGHLYGHVNIDHFYILGRASSSKNETMNVGATSQDGRGVFPVNMDDISPEAPPKVPLSAYQKELWEQYAAAGKDLPKDQIIIQVVPSVLPAYNPALRVYSYQLQDNPSSEQEDQDDQDDTAQGTSTPSPLPFGTSLGYTQYWANLTRANLGEGPFEYEIEYETGKDYGMKSLSVQEWLTLAHRIVEDEVLKDVYMARMVIQTNPSIPHTVWRPTDSPSESSATTTSSGLGCLWRLGSLAASALAAAAAAAVL